jgi:hypothetical protein
MLSSGPDSIQLSVKLVVALFVPDLMMPIPVTRVLVRKPALTSSNGRGSISSRDFWS